MAECNTRQRLSEIGHDAVQYFMEKLLFNIYDRFDEQDLTDVTFKLSNPNAMVKAHRLILSAASPYFRDLFRDEKGICPVIEINNIDSDIFEQLIIFCYTGKTFITNDNVERVLKAALILQLEDTVADCGDFIIENISNYSIKRVYALEREIQCATLNQKLFEYETQNFMSVAESEEFLDFDANKLQKILECNSLNAPTERDVFEAVKRWYDYDALGRKQHLQDLISCLRLTQLDTTFLLTEIQTLPGCESIVVNALSWTNCPALRSNLTLKYTEKRGSQTTSNELLFALNIKERENKNIFQYDNDEGVWYKWFDVKITISDFGVIFMDTNFIFIGGSRCEKAINDVSRWNFKTKTFEQLPSMNQPRYSHSVLLLNETIYAIGGKDEHGVLKSVEKYTVSNGWVPINSMINPRNNAGAVAFNGKIYVIGGYWHTSAIDSVECYDPATDRWTLCTNLIDYHSCSSATVHNGNIYVIGTKVTYRPTWFGSDAIKSSTLERYDPQKNKWTELCCLHSARDGIGCISFNNQLWVVGGNVSVYDEEKNVLIGKRSIGIEGSFYYFTVHKAVFQSECEN